MKRGFTLLELLISCALLLAILGILATTINRAHNIRQDATRRTSLLAQGSAALDFIAGDLQSIISTNLEILASHPGHEGSSYSATNNAIRFSTGSVLAGITAGDFTNALPATWITYFVTTNDYPEPKLQGYALYRQSGAWSNLAVATSETFKRNPLEYPATGGSVTNIVAGFGTTRLPPALAGETIMVPVNSSSTSRVFDWDTSTAAWLDVVPADATGLTNQINATVIFSTDYAHLTTNIIERPPAGTMLWPEIPMTTVSTGYQALARHTPAGIFFAANSHTNTPSATNFWAHDWIRLTSVDVQQTVSTNNELVTTNTIPVVLTNDVTLASWTGVWATVQNSLPPGTTTPVRVAWAVTNLPPRSSSNYWKKIDGTVTNLFDARHDDQWDETFNSWQMPLNPIPGLTNLPWRLRYSMTNMFAFPPTGTNKVEWIPLELAATEIIEGAANGTDWGLQTLHWQAAIGTEPAPPFQSQDRHMLIVTAITNIITATNMVSAVAESVTIVVTNHLTALVPARVIATGHYDYITRPNRRRGGANHDIDTTWIPVTLQKDFEGAEVEVYSLWLEPDTRDGFGFNTEFAPITEIVGELLEPKKAPPLTPPRMLLDGVAACLFQPLAFKTIEEGEQHLLEIWNPDNTEPPVCIDIYLELIDPAVGRRAATMPEDKQAAFVRRQVVRLTKRVPLQTHNRWRAP